MPALVAGIARRRTREHFSSFVENYSLQTHAKKKKMAMATDSQTATRQCKNRSVSRHANQKKFDEVKPKEAECE
jgi:hypothetical protein